MYKLPDGQLDIYTLCAPLEALLDPENRWVLLARRVPWASLEQDWGPRLYASRGAPAKPLRLMLAALYIQKKLGLSDTQTLQLLRENPYMQYFAGMQEFNHAPPFHPSLLRTFRRRLDEKTQRKLLRLLESYEREPA